MSTILTKLKTSSGKDLSHIFKPGTSSTPTGYKIATETIDKDLSDFFAPFVNGDAQIIDTGYKIISGTEVVDLKTFFSPLEPFTITNGTFNKTSDTTYNYILTFFSNSSITFNYSISNVNYTVVGGGAGGNFGKSTLSEPGPGGRGGGGGQVIINSNIFNAGTYQITVGFGGTGGINEEQGPTAGSETSISTIVTATGGIINGGGSGGIYSLNGSNGTTGNGGYGSSGGGGGVGGSSSAGGAATGGGAGSLISGGSGGLRGYNETLNGNPGISASNNTGGGGGGGGGSGRMASGFSQGGNGGSGIVIIKFNYP